MGAILSLACCPWSVVSCALQLTTDNGLRTTDRVPFFGTTKDLRSSRGTFIRQLTGWPFKGTAEILRPSADGLRMTRGWLFHVELGGE